MPKTIDTAFYEQLINGANVLSHSSRGDAKVFILPDHSVGRIYHTKSALKRWLLPRGKQYITVTEKLQQRGVIVPAIKGHYVYPEKNYEIIICDWLAGQTMLEVGEKDITILAKNAAYLAELHAKGVYFRGVHFGNVLLLENGEFGLIDFLSTRFGMSLSRRVRNLRYVLKHEFDQPLLQQFGESAFLDAYFAAAQLNAKDEARCRTAISYNRDR